MKNRLLIIMVFLTLGCKAQLPPAPPPQQILPVEYIIDFIKSDAEIPDGYYFKDVNHVLDKYLGTWIGSYDNKTYEFQLVGYTNVFLGVTEDILLMRYKIMDSAGNVLENTLNLPDNSGLVIKGRYLSSNEANYILSYSGEKAECGQSGNIYINSVNNGQQMNLFLRPDDTGVLFPSLCPNGKADQVFPTPNDTPTYIALTKQ